MNTLRTDWLLFALLLPAAPVLLVGTYLGGILGVLCRDLADAPYLAAIMAAALAEREAQMQAGLVLLECVRVTARYHPELRAILDLGERVFGEGA